MRNRARRALQDLLLPERFHPLERDGLLDGLGPVGHLALCLFKGPLVEFLKGLVTELIDLRLGKIETVTALKNEASPTYCPVRALSRWRRAARVEEGPLFRGVRRDSKVMPDAISYKTLNRLVQRAWAGLEPEGFSSAERRRYSAHSLRADHVTDASSRGAPDNVLTEPCMDS